MQIESVHLYAKIVSKKTKENRMFFGEDISYSLYKDSSKEEMDNSVRKPYILTFDFPEGKFNCVVVCIRKSVEESLQGNNKLICVVAPESSLYILNASGQNIDSLHC